ATLEEIEEADVLVHVLDITHPNAEEQAQTVDSVLAELGVADKPKVIALNKIDRLFSSPDGGTDPSAEVAADLGLGPEYVPVSAQRGWGLGALLARIQHTLRASLAAVTVHIPYGESDLVSLFHEKGIIEHEEHTSTGTTITGRVPKRFVHRFARFQE